MHVRLTRVLAAFVMLAGPGCADESTSVEEGIVEGPRYEQELKIDAPVDVVWRAITEPAIVSTYYLAPLVKLDLQVGGEIIYGSAEQPLISGKVLEVELHRRLVHTFVFDPGSQSGAEADLVSRVTYELNPDGRQTVLKLTHDQFEEESQSYADVTGGWPIILSRLKERIEGSDTSSRTQK